MKISSLLKTQFSQLKKYPILWLILIAVILVSLPLFKPGMFKIHDFTHGARIAEMTRALKDGHFPVRWSQNFGYGYGMPLFQFYGPLPFYVGTFLFWLTKDLVFSVKAIFFISSVFTAWGGYLLGKKLFNNNLSATFVSLAITLAPYRMLNLYVRGAVNELWGMMALPWIILSFIKIINGEKKGWLWLTVSLTTLFLSHNITTLIFAPFAVLVAVLLLAQQAIVNKLSFPQIIHKLVQIFIPCLLAIGLSAFYLFPAYFEKSFTQVDQHILAEYFDFRIHFVYLRQFFRDNWGYGGSDWGPDDKISFFLGYGQLFAVFFFVYFTIKHVLTSRQSSLQVMVKKYLLPIGFFLLAVFSIALTTQKTQFIWETISLMEFIQFPWRFLSLSSIFLAIAGGYAVSYLQNKKNISVKFFKKSITFFSIILIFGLTFLNGRFVKPEKQLNQPELFYYEDESKIRNEMSQILPDYIPIGLKTSDPADALINEDILPDDQKNKLQIILESTQLKQIKTNFTRDLPIEFNVADYPEWKLFVNSAPVQHEVSEIGLIKLLVYPGEQVISLRLQPTLLRLISDLVSLTSFVVIVVLLLRQKQFGFGRNKFTR